MASSPWRVTSEALIGRDAEAALLQSFASEIEDGRPSVALISGEGGIGKTRLVTEALEPWRAMGATILAGGSPDLAAAPPYAALLDAFRDAPPAIADEVVDALTGAVDLPRTQLFEAVRSAIVRSARRSTVVVVIEDLHWADRASLDLLRYCLATGREGRWALVATYRDDEARGRPEVLDFLADIVRGPATRISLAPLSRKQVAQQIASITGSVAASAAVERIHRRSDGLPLLVEELVAAEAAGIMGVPEHLRDLLLRWVADVEPVTAQVLAALAVVAGGCDEALLCAVIDQERSRVLDGLEEAVRAGVIATGAEATYRFRHELLREAVYEDLLPARRRDLHAAVARALEAAGGADHATLARHWDEGGRADPAAIAHLAAAEAAERLHAPVAAQAHWERVLALWERVTDPVRDALGDRSARLARAAEAAYLAGDFPRAVALAEESVAASPDEAVTRAARLERLGRYRWVARDGPGADDAYTEAVRTVPADAPDRVRAQILAGYAWVLTMSFRSEQAQPMAEAALEAAERSGDPLARCRALLAWGYERDPQALQEACELAAGLDAGDEVARSWIALDLTLRAQGLAAQRLDVLGKGIAYAESMGLDRSYRKLLSLYLGESLLDLGRWDEAGDVLDRLLAEEPQGMLLYFSTAQRARLAAGRGQTAQAHRLAEQVIALGADIPQQPFPTEVARVAHAEAHLWEDRPDLADAAVRQLFASPARDDVTAAEGVAAGLRAVADLAEQAAFAGDRDAVDAARSGVPDLLARLPEDDQPRISAWAATAAAEASRAEGGSDPEPWRAAASAWDEAAGPYPGAYARWRLARALLASRSGRREATAALREGLEVAARLGATPLAQAIEKLAASARLRIGAVEEPREVAAAREIGLTPREFEILPLLAAGRTNREIAAALYISPRTVGVHVSRVLRKLEISRRAEIAEAARRRGLLGPDPR